MAVVHNVHLLGDIVSDPVVVRPQFQRRVQPADVAVLRLGRQPVGESACSLTASPGASVSKTGSIFVLRKCNAGLIVSLFRCRYVCTGRFYFLAGDPESEFAGIDIAWEKENS